MLKKIIIVVLSIFLGIYLEQITFYSGLPTSDLSLVLYVVLVALYVYAVYKTLQNIFTRKFKPVIIGLLIAVALALISLLVSEQQPAILNSDSMFAPDTTPMVTTVIRGWPVVMRGTGVLLNIFFWYVVVCFFMNFKLKKDHNHDEITITN